MSEISRSRISASNASSFISIPDYSNTKLFAVLIGIDTYASSFSNTFPSLRYAAADALGVNEYLHINLGVPSDQITILTNEKATRAAIIGALKDLREDRRIQTGDAIVIYYAGHGTEIDPPENWKSDWPQTKMQAIVPYDCEMDNIAKVWLVPPIPALVLGVLLARIASQKGNNITVIFDSCHSVSGTRGESGSGALGVRSVEVPSLDYDETLDHETLLEETRFLRSSSSSKSSDLGLGLGSHVLLAACGSTQLAREDNRHGHGIFTASLLKLLNQVPPDRLRYSDILIHPNLEDTPKQDPQIEGLHVNRTLFNGKIITQRKVFPVSFDKKITPNGRYLVHGGTIHNMTLDSEFAVYRATDSNFSQQLGILHVDELFPFSLIAKLPNGSPKFDLSQAVVAIEVKELEETNYLRIHVPHNNDFINTYRGVRATYATMYNLDNIRVVDESQDPHVVIMLTDKKLSMAIRTVTHHKFNHVIEDLNVLPWLLSRITHFYRELGLPKEISNGLSRVLHNNIEVEFYRLQEVSMIDAASGFQNEKLEPAGSNLYVGDGMIDLVVVDENGYPIPYGLKLVNKSDQDFHVNLFHFTNSDLSILPCVEPYSNGTHIFNLPQQSGELKIGYGPEGHSPICFAVADGYNTDVGFLKIYLSTEFVNLDLLLQSSPFDETSTTRMKPYIPIPKVPWTEIVIPITQNRN